MHLPTDPPAPPSTRHRRAGSWSKPRRTPPSPRARWWAPRCGRRGGPPTCMPMRRCCACANRGRRVRTCVRRGGAAWPRARPCMHACARGQAPHLSPLPPPHHPPAHPPTPTAPVPGYKIPRGGLFEWVSAANYAGEIFEWAGWALAAGSLPAAAFAWFTFCNLAPRGWRHHLWWVGGGCGCGWGDAAGFPRRSPLPLSATTRSRPPPPPLPHRYKQRFPRYPPQRRAVIPFVW